MRNWLAPVLLAALPAAGLGQSPTRPPGDPPPIVISPQRPGTSPAKTSTPGPAPAVGPNGAIVIRPNGSATQPQPQPATPKVIAPAAPAATPPPAEEGKELYDFWFSASVEGRHIGHMRWTARELDRDGRKVWVGVKTNRFTLSRFGQVITQWAEESTHETPEGAVLATTFRQGIGAGQALVITGVVEGKVLKARGEGVAAGAQDTPWPDGVVGVAREPFLIRDQKLKAGASFEYPAYIPNLNRVAKVTIAVEGEETAALWKGHPAKKLIKSVSKMEAVGNFRLPPSILWSDAESHEPLKVEFDFPGLGGRVSFLRTTKDAAERPVTDPIELFNVQSVRLNRLVENVHERAGIVYRVTMPADDDPATAFAADARQEVKALDPKAKTFELHAARQRGPQAGVKPAEKPGAEFLGSSYFINWENDAVKAHARAAAAGLPAGATDWDKAKAAERWVKANMRSVEFSQAMATADNVAKTLSGDCTEYAMLTAAICRANGVPARTALGLVALEDRPFLAYHMWTEVFAGGQWVGLDATLGRGGVGPGHVKITDHSWHAERSFAPLLPVLRVLMAKPGFEVTGVKE